MGSASYFGTFFKYNKIGVVYWRGAGLVAMYFEDIDIIFKDLDINYSNAKNNEFAIGYLNSVISYYFK